MIYDCMSRLLRQREKKEDRKMEEIKKDQPRYYNESRREATKRYREKRLTIQCTLTFKTWKKALIDEQAKKRGTNINRYFLGMMENDAKGKVYIIPDITTGNAADAIREISAAKTVKTENIRTAMKYISASKADAKALTELAADAGIKKEDIVRSFLVYISAEMTYMGAETILESLEAYGADRNNLIAAVKEAGIIPTLPAQCALTKIVDPEKDQENPSSEKNKNA